MSTSEHKRCAEEQREVKLQGMCTSQIQRLAAETEEQREARLQGMRTK